MIGSLFEYLDDYSELTYFWINFEWKNWIKYVDNFSSAFETIMQLVKIL